MNNKKYNEINIPDAIDIKINEGIAKANLEMIKKISLKRKKFIASIIACLVAVITLGFVNPALASKIPIIGNVFEAIEKNIYYPGNYSEYATSVNETIYSNGIGITLSEILCDGHSLYVTYIIENDEPFKYTSTNNSKTLDINQLITSEAYNKVDFSDEPLDNSGFAGLEGRFIDEHTFIGIEKYRLSSFNTEIPENFIFQTKINSIEVLSYSDDNKSYLKRGSWAFKVPVNVNSNLVKNIDLTDLNIESNHVKINSISITPFEIFINTNYKNDDWIDYTISVYDENMELLSDGLHRTFDYINTKAPNSDAKFIRLVIQEPISKSLSTTESTVATTSINQKELKTIFDEIIPLK